LTAQDVSRAHRETFYGALKAGDLDVHPELQRFLAKRMSATVTEVESSHVPMLSHPKVVLDVIGAAVKAVQKATPAQSV
jgi:enolase